MQDDGLFELVAVWCTYAATHAGMYVCMSVCRVHVRTSYMWCRSAVGLHINLHDLGPCPILDTKSQSSGRRRPETGCCVPGKFRGVVEVFRLRILGCYTRVSGPEAPNFYLL